MAFMGAPDELPWLNQLGSVSKPFNCRLLLLGREFIIVAFRSAKVASVNATFAEQKATHLVALSIV
jgi:hypothetical protein